MSYQTWYKKRIYRTPEVRKKDRFNAFDDLEDPPHGDSSIEKVWWLYSGALTSSVMF